MKKSLFTALAVGLCMTAHVMAQVPSYVPTNGLVGFWPFNGNANDESGNGNNGTVNGATLTTDRFGNANKAYSFNGSSFISVSHNNSFNMTQATWNVWVKKTSSTSGNGMYIFGKRDNSQHHVTFCTGNTGNCQIGWATNQAIGINGGNIVGSWHMLTITYNQGLQNSNVAFYFDGILQGNSTIQPFTFMNGDLRFGIEVNNSYWQGFNGFIDEGIIYNRVLNNTEILQLYNGCSGNEIISQPINSINTIGSNALFSVNSQSGSTYLWQSNPSNFGWQNVPNNANYSGGTTNTLTVSNVQLSNHNQPFRVIASLGNCADTSSIATIEIADTCITNVMVYDTLTTNVYDTLTTNITVYDTLTTNVYDTLTTNITIYDTLTTNIYDTLTTNITVYDTITTNITIYDTLTTNVYDTTYIIVSDTLFTAVTDTLIINTTLSLPAPNNENTILIYPNPASDHITIDNGNYIAMAGYTIKIENNAGQQVFQSAIDQQQFYVDLSTWSGNGLYFVHLIDPQNNTITVRKIVLQ
jgi:hypothetical protein